MGQTLDISPYDENICRTKDRQKASHVAFRCAVMRPKGSNSALRHSQSLHVAALYHFRLDGSPPYPLNSSI